MTSFTVMGLSVQHVAGCIFPSFVYLLLLAWQSLRFIAEQRSCTEVKCCFMWLTSDILGRGQKARGESAALHFGSRCLPFASGGPSPRVCSSSTCGQATEKMGPWPCFTPTQPSPSFGSPAAWPRQVTFADLFTSLTPGSKTFVLQRKPRKKMPVVPREPLFILSLGVAECKSLLLFQSLSLSPHYKILCMLTRFLVPFQLTAWVTDSGDPSEACP